MPDTEIIAVCSEIHTKHTNTLCGQNVTLLYLTPMAFIGLTCHHVTSVQPSTEAHNAHTAVWKQISGLLYATVQDHLHCRPKFASPVMRWRTAGHVLLITTRRDWRQ
jgi:hypothetical protein